VFLGRRAISPGQKYTISTTHPYFPLLLPLAKLKNGDIQPYRTIIFMWPMRGPDMHSGGPSFFVFLFVLVGMDAFFFFFFNIIIFLKN